MPGSASLPPDQDFPTSSCKTKQSADNAAVPLPALEAAASRANGSKFGADGGGCGGVHVSAHENVPPGAVGIFRDERAHASAELLACAMFMPA